MQYLGIDVGKDKIDCCLMVDGRYFHRVLKNNPEGHQKLSQWLAKYGNDPVHACIEATGIYGEKVAEYLYDNGHTVSVCNPLKIKRYAEGELQNVKTDKQDAKTIAKYCQEKQPEPYTPPTPIERQLKALTRQLDHLKEMKVAQGNRLQVATPITQPIISDTIANIDKQIEQVQGMISAHIAADDSLKHKADLLKTVRGIGDATIPHLLTLFAQKQFPNVKAVTKYVGLNPIIKQSGNSKAKFYSISKMGDKHVRTALYMPALIAHRLPEYKPFIKRLKDAGKNGKQICVALMRKILVYCYTVLKTGKPFNASFLNPSPI